MVQLTVSIQTWIQNLWERIFFRKGSAREMTLFYGNFIEVKAFYLETYGRLPSISLINDIDVTRAFAYISEGHAGKVQAVYQRCHYNWQKQQQEFTRTIFKLAGKTMIELGEDYAELLFDTRNYELAEKLVKVFSENKAAAKEIDHEINIITFGSYGLELKQLEIQPTALDIGLYYNDDFAAVDALIRERLMKDKDKGIVLLHGLPGTGKTTYLRHLIGQLKKKVLFVSPGVAGNLVNPEFIELLISNPNSILVIEDAENLIMDRKYNADSSVSNLLNISDGLLSDCLNVQIICTFNSSLSMIDNALMRKGRLIAKYEFGKLEKNKARKLAETLGINQPIETAMTLAEITNPATVSFDKPVAQTIGFRRELAADQI